MATTIENMDLTTMRRAPAFGLPLAEAAPKGPGHGPLRELLAFISRRSESFAWRWDDGTWNHEVTDRAMFEGDILALEPYGIGAGHVIEQTDSPVRFVVTGKGIEPRTLELVWDSISYDLMGMPPHVKKLPGAARVGLLIGGVSLSWVGILAAFGVFA